MTIIHPKPIIRPMKATPQSKIYEFQNASAWLKSIFDERKKRNDRYSLRSLAKFLNISHSSLVRLFQEKTTLSPQNIEQIIKNLDLAPAEAEYFRLIASTTIDENKLDQLKVRAQTQKIEIDSVASILNLNAVSLLQMIEVSDKIPFNVLGAAKKLSLSKNDIQYLIDHLKRLNLVTGSGNDLRCTQNRILLETAESKAALIRYYKLGLIRAAESLDTDSPQERAIATETLAFDESDLPEAEKIMDEALNRLVVLSQKSKNPVGIYQCMNMIYRLTHKKENSCA